MIMCIDLPRSVRHPLSRGVIDTRLMASCIDADRQAETQLTSHPDRMFAEVDRQLDLVRTQVDAVATRSGFLIATTAVVAAVLAARIQTGKPYGVGALWALGIAGVLGTLTLVPMLRLGPQATELQRWGSVQEPRARVGAVVELYHAKIMVLEGNRIRLSIMLAAFYLQTVAVVVAVVLTLISTRGR